MKESERKILLELLENGRNKITDIADKFDISRQTVSKRIEGMLEEGTIERFTLKLSDDRIGLRIKSYVFLNIVPSSELRHEFVQEAKKIKNISQIHHMFGRFDMLLEILVKDEEELNALLDRLRDFEAVEETETLICKYTEKNNPQDPYRVALSE